MVNLLKIIIRLVGGVIFGLEIESPAADPVASVVYFEFLNLTATHLFIYFYVVLT